MSLQMSALSFKGRRKIEGGAQRGEDAANLFSISCRLHRGKPSENRRNVGAHQENP
jgi:hypothetical protein